MVEHVLKTSATVWDAVESGEKRFEVRRNDRFFQRGDSVILQRFDSDGTYTPKDGVRWSTCDLKFTIGWMLQGGQFGIEPGYIVFQLEPFTQKDSAHD